MKKRINSYNDLLKEEEQLEELLQAQKELVLYDFNELKKGLSPATTALNFLGRITTRDRGQLLISGGVNKLIDILFNKVILSRAGWLTKLTVPFFIKNYASHFLADHKEQFMEKLFSWISQKNGNGKVAPEAHDKEY